MPIKRSNEMVMLAYFLAKYGEKSQNGANLAPVEFSEQSLQGILKSFYPHLGDGRTLKKFVNSMRQTVNFFREPQNTSEWLRKYRDEHPWLKLSRNQLWLELQRLRGVREMQAVSRKSSRRRQKFSRDVTEVDLPSSFQLDYKYRTRRKIASAKRREQQLLHDYQQWLLKKERYLTAAKYQQLRCDGYEAPRHNLIEGKSSASREHIRMAVGQLLDYEFQGKYMFGELNKAILLPTKPEQDSIAWLKPLKIAVIWPERSNFVDNANGIFA